MSNRKISVSQLITGNAVGVGKYEAMSGRPEGELPSVRDALGDTVSAIQARARLYRNLVVTVCAVGAGAVVAWTAVSLWVAVAVLALLVPLVGAYFALDALAVRNWAEGICRRWRVGLDLAAFRSAATAHPVLPQLTVAGMLARLPQIRPWERVADGDKLEAMKQLRAQTRGEVGRIAAGTAALFGLLMCVAAAAFLHSALPLTGCAACLVLWLVARRG